MASTINSATSGVVITSDATGALDIQVGGTNAIQISSAANVSVPNLSATSASITTLSATSANITTATGTTFSATTMGAQSTTTFLGTSANITTFTSSSGTITTLLDGSGNVRNIPSAGSTKVTSYNLATTDIGEFVTVGTGGSVTVPNNTFVTGNVFSIYNDTTGNVSINLSTTTAYLVGTNTNRTGVTLATRGIATVLIINPSYCIVSGNVT